jgi:hypothetical protein
MSCSIRKAWCCPRAISEPYSIGGPPAAVITEIILGLIAGFIASKLVNRHGEGVFRHPSAIPPPGGDRGTGHDHGAIGEQGGCALAVVIGTWGQGARFSGGVPGGRHPHASIAHPRDLDNGVGRGLLACLRADSNLGGTVGSKSCGHRARAIHP